LPYLCCLNCTHIFGNALSMHSAPVFLLTFVCAFTRVSGSLLDGEVSADGEEDLGEQSYIDEASVDAQPPGSVDLALLGNQEQVDDSMQYSIDDDVDLKPFLSDLAVNQSLFHEESQGEEAASAADSDEISGLRPEAGDKIPKFAQTFPGCSCTFEESRNAWLCTGSIAMPKSVAGDPCCCCTLGCDKTTRCTNDQCLAIGIDQAAEIAAEEKRLADLLKGADILLGGAIPAYKVMLPQGQRCMRSKIVQACKDQSLTPLCDHSSYWNSGGRQCWYADVKSAQGKSFLGHHFSLPSHNRAMGLDPNDLAGMCFYAVHGDYALVNTGSTHTWSNAGAGTAVQRLGKRWTFSQMDSQANGHAWFTLCTKNPPQITAPQR